MFDKSPSFVLLNVFTEGWVVIPELICEMWWPSVSRRLLISVVQPYVQSGDGGWEDLHHFYLTSPSSEVWLFICAHGGTLCPHSVPLTSFSCCLVFCYWSSFISKLIFKYLGTFLLLLGYWFLILIPLWSKNKYIFCDFNIKRLKRIQGMDYCVDCFRWTGKDRVLLLNGAFYGH